MVKEKDGRSSRYEVQRNLPLPSRLIRSATVREVLAVLVIVIDGV
ncbi:hypothetical protein [Arthrobacter alpinus]|nr:hypothetical protein [Arthrobacter alpinus]